jgi:hypothetical protein
MPPWSFDDVRVDVPGSRPPWRDGFDAIDTNDWPIMRRMGLVPTLAFPTVTPAPFRDGIGHQALHDRLEPQDGAIGRHLRDNIQWIAHVHTAGVPGRYESRCHISCCPSSPSPSFCW